MTKTVVVFGGAGFIGTHLLRRFVADPSLKLVSYDIRDPATAVEGVDYRYADVRDLGDLLLPEDTDRIYNLAAVHTTPGHPDHEYYETNINGALEITRLAGNAGIDEIIFTSSISVYGPGEDTKTEDTPLTPTSAYGYSKMIAEKAHRQWRFGGPSRKLTVVRPAVVFGPGEGGNFTRLAKLMKKGFFIYPGRKDTIKACIYVEDLLDAIEFARQNSDGLVTFNAAYPQRYTIERIVQTFSEGYYPGVREYAVPKPVMMSMAKFLGVLDFLHLGVHPDRVLKLIRSTDVAPNWLVAHGWEAKGALERGLERWAIATDKRFV